ncbi:MAG TPA: hypothetical protein VKB93_15460 [Thermoanaerobaculia bacterium]|nr:hypothetical protein [Thermoanaerobaculia bacterium]
MGYELHITRAVEHWSSNQGLEITLDEWRQYLRTDPRFELTDAAETLNPATNERLVLNRPGLAQWNGHTSGDSVWFSWWRGNVSVKNPDDEVIQKMLAIALLLRARVQGDDGEWYDEQGEHSDDSEAGSP